MKTSKRLHIFLAHARDDEKRVLRLYRRLTRDGMDAWLDRERLQPGQDWDHEIRTAIHYSDLVIVCLSNRYVNKRGYCQNELRMVLDEANLLPPYATFIIPARLDACEMPEPLRRWQRVDLFREGGYQRLMGVLREQVESK
jgi:hypothetical protein